MSVVRASPPPSAKAAIEAAHAEFAAFVRKAGQTGDLPRLSDPEGARIFSALLNEPAILGAAPYGAGDCIFLSSLITNVSALIQIYMLFPGAGEPASQIDANFKRFQDEIIRLQTFALRVMAASAEASEADWVSRPVTERTPVRRQGIAMMQLGFGAFLEAGITLAFGPGLNRDNRIALTEALVRTVPTISRALSPVERARLAAPFKAIDAVGPPKVRDHLAPLLAALNRTDCTGICALEQ